METKKIGFIGSGNMASSLISGLIASGHSSQLIWATDIDTEKCQQLADNLQINIANNNQTLTESVDVVVLAVKPQALHHVSKEIAALTQQNKTLIVSIAAGVNQNSLSQWLGEEVAIVRCMPNTPALVLTSATALHANSKVTTHQRDLAENILRAVGLALWVEQEKDLDAVTAVSGSGPAYFFLLMEAMEKTAKDLGLSEDIARLLVQQTALGAAKIGLESSESPQELRHRVTSPGGTTQRAIETFQQGNFEDLVSKALRAAHDRSIEMSISLEQS